MKNYIIYKSEYDHSNNFIIIKYPDGQRNIKINIEKLNVKNPVIIKCRIKTFNDLEILGCMINSLKRNDFYIEKLEFIYLLGIRCDRVFEIGQPNYFKDVICPIINSFQLNEISVLWPFSPLPIRNNYINNCHNEYYNYIGSYLNYDISISGDESSNFFQGSSTDLYFKKIRDEKCEISLKIKIPDHIKNKEIKSILVVDDLCDGGRTFIEGAKLLNEIFPNSILNLFVYHAIFSSGTQELLKYYNKIFCTDSYNKLDESLKGEIEGNSIIQYDSFTI